MNTRKGIEGSGWGAVEANCKKRVVTGENKWDALRLHPFMTILTSSVKEMKNRNVRIMVQILAETPSNYSMWC